MNNDNTVVPAVVVEAKPDLSTALKAFAVGDETLYQVGLNSKGIYTKELSFAGVMGFGSGKERSQGAEFMYKGQIANGNFRPFINDMLELMVSEGVKECFMGGLPEKGTIKKYKLIEACNLVINILTKAGAKKGKTFDDMVVGFKKKTFMKIAREYLDMQYSVGQGAEAVQAEAEAEAEALKSLKAPQ